MDSIDALKLKAEHNNMSPIISGIRWPPRDGETVITGTDLDTNYKYYFEGVVPTTPKGLTDDYEISNWLDCHKVAELWKKWKKGGITS